MITLRLATPADAQAIQELLRTAFADLRPLYTAEAFAATTPDAKIIVSRLAEGPVWLAQHGGVVGTVSAQPRAQEVYVRSMAVLPVARGRGIGQQLLQEVERFASSRKAERLVLSTTPFLRDAIRLYLASGFKPAPEGPFDLHGTPLMTMVKHL